MAHAPDRGAVRRSARAAPGTGWLATSIEANSLPTSALPLSTLPRFEEAIGEMRRQTALRNQVLIRTSAERGEANETADGFTRADLSSLRSSTDAISVLERAIALVGNPGLTGTIHSSGITGTFSAAACIPRKTTAFCSTPATRHRGDQRRRIRDGCRIHRHDSDARVFPNSSGAGSCGSISLRPAILRRRMSVPASTILIGYFGDGPDGLSSRRHGIGLPSASD